MSVEIVGIPELVCKARKLDKDLRAARSEHDDFLMRQVTAERLQNQALLLGFLIQYYEEREGPITEC